MDLLILFDSIPKAEKYIIFKLNVVQQTTFLTKIVVSIGGTINIFRKDLTKKNELSKKVEWINDNSKIIKVEKMILLQLLVGDTTIFLKENNSQKIITFTRVMVRKISRI